MKFYLSSYKIGNKEFVEKLKELVSLNKKVAYIPNALDFSRNLKERQESEKDDIAQLKNIGFVPKRIDLKNYFGQKDKLETEIRNFGFIWVRGGNVFVLNQAMRLSGFDKILKKLIKEKSKIVYGGYSAGVCVLGKTLKYLDLVDDAKVFPYPQIKRNSWRGLGIIDFTIIPHYQSNHPETKMVEKVVEEYKKSNLPFKTLKDGQVLILEV